MLTVRLLLRAANDNDKGQLTKRTDPRGKATQWQYDVEGRLTSKIYADASTLVTAYDPVTSRVQSVTDALNQVKTFAYGEDDRVTGVAYTGAVNPTPNVSFAYDTNFPRLTSMTDGTGTTTYGYYPVGVVGGLRLQTETQPLAAIGYAYDKLGRVKSRSVTGAGTEAFGYDALDRLTTHASDLGSFTLGYLGQTGQITTRSLASPSNLATTWGYLPNSGDRRLASVSTTGLTAGQSTGFAYTTNAENFITGTSQTSDAAVAVPPSVVTQTGTYNNLNQLTNLTGQHLTWDADGNLLKDATRTYSWDAENRLVAIGYIGVSGQTTTFAYDGLGRRARIARTPQGGGTTTTNYIWCGSQLCQARTAAGAEARGYYAEGEFVPGSPSTSLYYAPDNLGSVRRVFSAGASPSYDYDPYGAPNQTTAPVTDFNYAGTVYNADYSGSSGLYLTTHRPYDPVAGRFLSRDPIGEAGDPAGNLYAYAGGGPVGLSDPNGTLVGGPIWSPLQGLLCLLGGNPQPPRGPLRGGAGRAFGGPSARPNDPVDNGWPALILGGSASAVGGAGFSGSAGGALSLCNGFEICVTPFVSPGLSVGAQYGAGGDVGLTSSLSALGGASYGGSLNLAVGVAASANSSGGTATLSFGPGAGAALTASGTSLGNTVLLPDVTLPPPNPYGPYLP